MPIEVRASAIVDESGRESIVTRDARGSSEASVWGLTNETLARTPKRECTVPRWAASPSCAVQRGSSGDAMGSQWVLGSAGDSRRCAEWSRVAS